MFKRVKHPATMPGDLARQEGVEGAASLEMVDPQMGIDVRDQLHRLSIETVQEKLVPSTAGVVFGCLLFLLEVFVDVRDEEVRRVRRRLPDVARDLIKGD